LHGTHARTLAALDRLPEALAASRLASGITQRLVAEGVRSMVVRDGSVGESSVHANAALRSGAFAEALKSAEHAIAANDQLIADQPDLPNFKRNRLLLHFPLAWARIGLQQPKEALAALDVLDQLTAQDPKARDNPSIARRLIHAQLLRAQAMAALNQSAALAIAEAALAEAERFVAHPQFGREHQHNKARALALVAQLAPTAPERALARTQGLETLQKMQTVRPLGSDHTALLEALQR
jgi:hypothetical protein